jgi:hypothetical protein
VAALLASVGPVSTAGAYTEALASGGNCSGGGLQFAFTGSGWTGSGGGSSWDARPTLRNHIYEWEDEKEYNSTSTPVVDLSESSGEIEIKFDAGVTGFASASCSGDEVLVSDSLKPDPSGPSANWYDDMGSLLQHEIGHTMGHLHTGYTDSHDGEIPTMATCRPSFAHLGYREFSQDDRQNHQRLNGSYNPRSISANLGFAAGVDYFHKTGGYWYMSGATLRFRRSTPSATADKFYQRHVIAGSSGQSYDIWADWDRVDSGVEATVWTSMYARTVNYTWNNCGIPDPVAGHAFQTPRSPLVGSNSGTWWFKVSGSDYIADSHTSHGTVATSSASMSGNTVDIEIRLSHSAASTSGSAQYLTFDNVRLRER